MPLSPRETDRLDCLRDFGLTEAVDFPGMARVTELAAAICDTAFAAITIVGDTETQMRATVGIQPVTIEREHTVCNYTMLGHEPFCVEDFTQDPRFADNPYVVDGPQFRAYAGVPVDMEPGLPAGSLCVLDNKPRKFTPEQIKRLQALAELASEAFRHSDKANRLAASLVEIRAHQDELIRRKGLIKHQKRMLDEATSLASMGAFEYDTVTDTMIWSDSMYAIHGMEPGTTPTVADMAGRMSQADREHFQKEVLPRLASGIPADIETQQQLDNGEWRWYRLRIHPVLENGRQVRRYGVKQDITEQKKLLDEVSFLASHDQLTGLINRYELRRRFTRFLEAAQKSPSRIGLAMIDLDGFKDINDTLGHDAGDACLRAIAARLKRACGNYCEIARYGGDEFQVLYRVPDRPGASMDLFSLLAQIISKPVKWRSHSLDVTASIGFSDVSTSESCDLSDLQQRADLSVIQAKSAGKNCAREYTPLMRVELDRRATIVRSIGEAIRSDQLMLYYQPQFNLQTRKCCGFEALLRWTTADGRVLSPGAFSEALADPRLSRRIDTVVLELALQQAAEWRNKGRDFGAVAINLTRSTLNHEHFDNILQQLLDASGLQTSDIALEITENVVLSRNSEQIEANLARLSDRGMQIYLDDFGTGYASLSHLRSLPFSGIKIDKSFVTNLPDNQVDRALVRNISDLASSLGKQVVVEGVETPEQLAELDPRISPVVQGYLLGEPMSASEIDAQWSPKGELLPQHPIGADDAGHEALARKAG